MSLINPQDVIEYTEIEAVKNRGSKLSNDIMQAEAKVFEIVGHDFSNLEKYPDLPEKAKLALILWAEYYAIIATDTGNKTGKKAEAFDDYSYTNGSMKEPDTDSLLRTYIEDGSSGERKVTLRIRGL